MTPRTLFNFEILRRVIETRGSVPEPKLASEPTPEFRYFRNRSILISGAGGTVGTELCRQLLACQPARLVLVDRSELNLAILLQKLDPIARDLGITLHSALECVSRTNRMRQMMQDYGVSVVLHAAAYKHVPMVEVHPVVGIENNLFGTVSMARAAQAAGTTRFLLVSTDKAIAPTGLLGASKLLSELAIWDIASESNRTRFSAVRFGNVYGSSGSAVPIWQEQISTGGPITLTDPKATRYFMSVEEAAQLVLQAVVLSTGKDLFALDMGRPRSILSVAKELMAEAGRPGLKIICTGLRPGERLHEPAPVSATMEPTAHPRIMRAEPEQILGNDIRLLLRSLAASISANDAAAVRRLVNQWVYSNTGADERRSI